MLDRARESGNLIGGYGDVYLRLAAFSAMVAIMAAMLRAPRTSKKGGET
jgi:hypothetical protein